MSGLPLPWMTLAIVVLAVGTTVRLLLLRHKSDAEVLFALFCGSVALAMLRPWVGTDAGGLWWVVAVGGSATCNVYWLVARALFRGDGAVGWPHAAVALGIALLIVGWRVISREDAAAAAAAVSVIGSLLDLAGPAVLALAFAEGLRGWSATLPAEERRLRLGFLLVFGGCVLSGTISRAIGEAMPGGHLWQPAVNSSCALVVVGYTLWALTQRRRRPWPAALAQAEVPPTAAEPPCALPTEEDRQLAAAIQQLLETQAIHRQPELKVADLAQRLDSAEHKVSRAITHGLGERNFNRLINRYRIRQACQLLEDRSSTLTVLEISIESGFASLGPFNRAFKAATGQTPSAYRAAHQRGATAASSAASSAASTAVSTAALH